MMVKRAITVALGAAAGVLLWFVSDWSHTPAGEDDQAISVETCVRDGYVDCVARQVTPDEAHGVPAPCKDWLSGHDTGAATLAQCLHVARKPQRQAPQPSIAGSI